jgi:PKD repeat protein
MLPSTRNNVSYKILKSNSAGVIVLSVLLLATVIVIPQGNLFSGLLVPAANAQQLPRYDSQDGENQQSEQQDGQTSDQARAASTEDLTAEIISNATRGVAPAPFEFKANVAGGTEPYTFTWNFDDDSDESDDQNVVHTFDEAGTYNVTLAATDADDETASDSLIITVKEAASPESDDSSTSTQSDESAASPESDDSSTSTQSDDSRLDDLKRLRGIPGVDRIPGLDQIPESGGGTDNSGTGGGTDNSGTGGGTDEKPGTGGGTDNNGTGGGTDENPPSSDNSGQGGTDKFGIEEIYPTASGGPSWFIREQEDPTSDGKFYYGMAEGTTVDYEGNGLWKVDATTGTQEHGIRMHVDSPTGKWKNEEITGYFQLLSGDDQVTMIARHGPSYHDNGGCEAYGYYGLTAADGHVFFKKKLYHYDGGYTKRLAQIDALDSILNRWIGMKFVVYDLPSGDVKLELWIDEGDMTNNWKKVTELVDDGGLNVEGGDDCGVQSNHIIKDGTRSSYRVDDSLFEFKKLSVREIEP